MDKSDELYVQDMEAWLDGMKARIKRLERTVKYDKQEIADLEEELKFTERNLQLSKERFAEAVKIFNEWRKENGLEPYQ